MLNINGDSISGDNSNRPPQHFNTEAQELLSVKLRCTLTYVYLKLNIASLDGLTLDYNFLSSSVTYGDL